MGVLLLIRGSYLTSRDDLTAVLALREQVFSAEQGFHHACERDAHDDMAVYALVYDEENQPAGTGRLYIDEEDRFTIGRLCVLKDRRGQGLGDLLMRMLLYRAQELHASAVYVEAQLPVVDFYARYGLRPVSDVFIKEGAPHRLMRATAEEIDIEGACHKAAAPCEDCAGGCAGCAHGAGKED